MVHRNPNAWRFNLDPRDPDYLEPPEEAEEDPEEPDEPVYDHNGPYHYVPPYEP